MQLTYKVAPGVDLTGQIGRFIRRVPGAIGVGVNTAPGTPSLGVLKQITSAGGVQVAVVASGEVLQLVTSGVAIAQYAPLTNDALGRAVLAVGLDIIGAYAQHPSVGATVIATLAIDDILVDPAATIAGLRTIGLGPLQAAAGTTLATAEAYTDAAILAAQIGAERVTTRTTTVIPDFSAVVLAGLNTGYLIGTGDTVLYDIPGATATGPYLVGAEVAGIAPLTRAPPWDTAAELGGASWVVEKGTWTGYFYGLLMRGADITLGVTPLTLTELARPTVVDGAAGVPSLRTLGTGASQAAAGTTLATAEAYTDAPTSVTTPLAYPYTTLAADREIAVDSTAARDIYLIDGASVLDQILLDAAWLSGTNPITVRVANATKKFNGIVNGTVTINVNGAIRGFHRDANGQWQGGV